MEDENGSPPGADQPSRITVNQVVAWNVAWYRNRAGLTQQELASMTGRTKSAVSELERSWNGKRPREFDAQALADFASALGIPLLALFLPPEIADGRFTVPACGDQMDMTGLMELVMPDNDQDTHIMDEYRRRLTRATGHFLDPWWAQDVARWLQGRDSAEVMAARALRLRDREQQLRAHAAEAGQLAAAIEAGLKGDR